MKLSKEEIEQVAQGLGADLVGIVDAESIPESMPPRPARDVLEGARSIIVFGIRMLSGSIQSPSLRVATTSNLAMYQEIDHIGYNLGRFLEEKNYLAAVIPPYQPTEMNRETLGLVGDLSLKHAAVGAGLGVFGKNHLILTPRWGPRVRLGAIVTNAFIPSDQPVSRETCHDCQLCIDSCPVGAISPTGNIDTIKCLTHVGDYGMSSFIRFLSQLVTKPPEEAKQLLKDPYFWNLYQYLSLGIMWNCFKCIEVCPVGQKQ